MAFNKQTKDGGYCPMCDTVWASPGKCNCFDISDANLGTTKKGYAIPNDSVYTKEIWNAAIDAAAKLADKYTRQDQAGYDFGPAIEIRKLKK